MDAREERPRGRTLRTGLRLRRRMETRWPGPGSPTRHPRTRPPFPRCTGEHRHVSLVRRERTGGAKFDARRNRNKNQLSAPLANVPCHCCCGKCDPSRQPRRLTQLSVVLKSRRRRSSHRRRRPRCLPCKFRPRRRRRRTAGHTTAARGDRAASEASRSMQHRPTSPRTATKRSKPQEASGGEADHAGRGRGRGLPQRAPKRRRHGEEEITATKEPQGDGTRHHQAGSINITDGTGHAATEGDISARRAPTSTPPSHPQMPGCSRRARRASAATGR